MTARKVIDQIKTLPPALKRKPVLVERRKPVVLVEERDGGMFLQPVVTLAVRNIPKAQVQTWIARDKAEMKGFAKAGLRRK